MKKRNRRCDPQKQSYWEEVVRRREKSGHTVRDYCRAEGLRESAFYFWRRKLARRSQPSGVVSPPRPEAAQVTPSPPGRVSPPRRSTPSFLPVHVVEHGEAEACLGVEIVLAAGRTVRVRSGFDRQTLADVLAVLEARPC
jgi:transposase-like protein